MKTKVEKRILKIKRCTNKSESELREIIKDEFSNIKDSDFEKIVFEIYEFTKVGYNLSDSIVIIRMMLEVDTENINPKTKDSALLKVIVKRIKELDTVTNSNVSDDVK